MSTNLTTTEKRQLTELETVIESGLKTFAEVGNALLAIRDSRLYRQTHETFEVYCRERWGFQKAYAHRLIASAQVVKNLSPMGDVPQSERQARPLAALEPEQQVEAWNEATEKADREERKVTAKDVEEAAEKQREDQAPVEATARRAGKAMEYAAEAIASLRKIKKNDSARHEAFATVKKWVTDNE